MAQQGSNLPATTGTVTSLQALLKKHQNQFAMVLPKSVGLDRFIRIVISTVTQNPKLLQCEQKTFLRSVLNSASLGLEPGGPLGLAHLVPFWNGGRRQYECQLIIDYKGYVALAHRSKEVGRVAAHIIYEKEPWKFTENDIISHTPLPPSERGAKKILVYAKAFDRGGVLIAQEFLWAEEVEAIKKKSLDGKKNPDLNPWNTNEEAMWRKSPVRRLGKWMPMAAEMQKAAIMEEYQEQGIDTPLDLDMELGEGPAAADAEQKTDSKANALRERLQQAVGQTTSGAPAGSSGQNDGPEPVVEGAEATPELQQETKRAREIFGGEFVGEDPGPTEPPSEMKSPEPPEPQGPTPSGPPPAEEQPKTDSAIHPSARKKDKDNTMGFSKGPRIEAGKKPQDYFLEGNMVMCPPGGEREKLLTNQKSYCDTTCKLRKRCFLFVE